ncbi:MAG TPA: hypothetical protein VN376_01775 [Longilinea sp.]|nr:hypothetical protein [Longilinea sp.]
MKTTPHRYPLIALTSLLVVTSILLAGCTPSSLSYPVIYELNFEDPEAYAGWHVGGPGTDLFWLENTVDGGYSFEFPSGFLQNWDLALTDIEISVDVVFQSDDPMDTSIGCRTDLNGGYWFTITNEQHWSIYKIAGGQSTLLAEGDSDQITSSENHLLAECVGSDLYLEVNGAELAAVSDDELTSGGITLGYNSFAANSGSFDDLLVFDLAAATPTPAANITATASETPSPAAIFTPSITSTPSPTPEGQVYSNDFGAEDLDLADWIIHETVDIRHMDEPQGYIFDLPQHVGQSMDGGNGQTVYAIYENRIQDTQWSLSEEMSFIGSGAASHALVCGYSPEGWYEMGINTDGHWQIEVVQGSPANYDHTVLIEGDSDAIVTSANSLEASCTDGLLSFSANDQVLGTIEDNSLSVGDMVGFTYQESTADDIHLIINRFLVTNSDGSRPFDLSLERDSFYFAWRNWATSVEYPQDIRSLVTSISTLEAASGAARINLTSPGRWIALLPQEFPHNVEVSIDVDAEHRVGTGFGIMCRWSESTGGYALWYTSGYVVTSPFSIDENGNPVYHGAEAEYATTEWENLLAGTQHHLTARCWGDLVELYVDGQRVASHQVSGFPMQRDQNKQGLMVGIMFWSIETNGATALIDNLIVSTGDILNTPVPSATP